MKRLGPPALALLTVGLATLVLAAAAQARFFRPALIVAWLIEAGLVTWLVGALGKARRAFAAKSDVASRALADSEDAHGALFEASPLPMLLFDAETLRFVAVNDAALQLYGYTRDELMGLTMDALKVPEEMAAFHSALSRTITMDARITTRHVKRDGTIVDVEVAGRTVTFRGRTTRFAVVVDRTDRERLEIELRQIQKMDALGRLAGSIAHDFNNLLMVISSFTSALIEDTPESHENHEALVQIQRACERSADLTKQLLAFSRQQPTRADTIDVNEAVSDVTALVRRLIGENVSLAVDLCDGPCRTHVDKGQFEQAIVNLAVNARDAMPTGGRLNVTTRVVHVPARVGSHLPSNVRAGNFVRLSVTDSGTGMDATVLSRIFEPFFTTKAKGKGTGLGLAIVFGVASRHGGYVDVRSEPGRGTTFELYLPASEDSPATAPNTIPPPIAKARGDETILLVDDDEAVLAAAENTLRRAGYRTLLARHPGEAIVVCEQHPGAIDLVLTDVRMPQMNGRQLADRLCRLRPALGVVYMSGYTDDVVLGDAAETVSFVQKPVAPATLLRVVRAELERSKRAAA